MCRDGGEVDGSRWNPFAGGPYEDEALAVARARGRDAVARNDARHPARDGAALRAREACRHADGVAALRAAHQGDQRAQERAQRGHPGAQLHDARDLPLRRRLPRRQPAARQGGRAHQGRRHRPGRRALHGRDLEASEPRQDGAHSGPARGLLARGLDHGRGRARAPRRLSRRARRHLRQHQRRREGRVRHLLHVVERREGRREPRRPARDFPARRVSRQVRADQDQGRDHRLEGPLRGARALHGRGDGGPACRRARA